MRLNNRFSFPLFSLFLTILFALSMSLPVLADQVLQVTEASGLTAEISQKELTRIFARKDRVVRVVSAEQSALLELDQASGQLFVKPGEKTPAEFHLTLFIESGKAVDLTLKTKEMSPETIELVFPSAAPVLPKIKANHHLAFILELTKAMANHTSLDGFKLTTEPVVAQMAPNTKATRVALYEDSEWIGEIYLIQNLHRFTVPLSERMFFANGSIAAIALEKSKLVPNEEGRLFLIKKRG